MYTHLAVAQNIYYYRITTLSVCKKSQGDTTGTDTRLCDIGVDSRTGGGGWIESRPS